MSAEFDALLRLETEDRIPLKRSASMFEHPPSQRTLRNYVLRGILCRITGERVKLEAYRGVGGHHITSVQAVRRFIARMNGASHGGSSG